MISSPTEAATTADRLDDYRYIVDPGPKEVITGLKAACSTDSAIVTKTALKILDRGGTAADAAIAACMVQAAVEPFMTNHAGTVTFLYYEAATGRYHQLDSAGTFPAGLKPFKPIPAMANGYAALPPSACIPGFMPGLKAIHERFGTRPWAELCEDAVAWAEEGHPVSSFEYFVNNWGEAFTTYFPEGRAFYRPDGHFTPVGQRFVPPGMAETMRRVADHGPDHMITGGWARKFIAKANEMGWPITADHMVETPPRWVEPFRFRHREWEIVSLGPPQQQGPFIAFVLGVLAEIGFRDVEPGSAEHYFYIGHALRIAQQHCGFIGDPEVADYAVEVLADPELHKNWARLIKGAKPKVDLTEHAKLTSAGGPQPGVAGITAGAGRPTRGRSESRQPSGSCELAIVDAAGNWVQMMNTLQSGGIPGMVIDGIPMVGSHATFGALSTPIDVRIHPGARMRQCLGNTMVLKEGRPLLSLGSPGNVAFTVPQVLAYFLEFGFSPYEAAAAPRMMPFGDDGTILVEDRLSDAALDGLAAMGVPVKVSEEWDVHMGSYQICYREEDGSLAALADPRRCGVADGLR